ncbi:MAG: tryptophan--tRNA ligase [Aaplasma endosymbiont of Hyalomma asiaticum]
MIFSGVQPSGCSLHLGNYLGAVRRWVDLQQNHECFFCVVDLHALTSGAVGDPELRRNSRALLASYIACGIDPNRSSVFLQSSVPEHSELCWILGCHTPVGWLNRMTQYKDKSRNTGCGGVTMGLFCYPVLMAADILLYKADSVPVGSDQRQHLELAQDIARTFNAAYKVDYLRVPSPLFFDTCTRVMSLKSGMKKMSKSDPSDFSRVNLVDSDDVIAQKIKKATTDSIAGFVLEELPNRPEMHNLCSIFAALSHTSVEDVCIKFEHSSTKEFKDSLTDLLIREIGPIRTKIRDLLDDATYLDRVLLSGNTHAREIAHRNMNEIKGITGLCL